MVDVVFIGYAQDSDAYRIMSLNDNFIFEYQDAEFFEHIFFAKKLNSVNDNTTSASIPIGFKRRNLPEEGFIVLRQEHKVWKLRKYLYGLKQAPKQYWDEKFINTMVNYDFAVNTLDSCVYAKTIDSDCVIIYVNDMLIFGTTLKGYVRTKDIFTCLNLLRFWW